MSLKINTITPDKKQIAEILRSVADWIDTSTNKKITIRLDLEFK